MSTIPQLAALKQRLNELSLQKSRYGISADPHITIEAQDLETVVNQMNLIDIHRRNLDTLLKQESTFGGHAPAYITNQIVTERANVARLRQVCARLGQNVPQHPVDADEEPDLPPVRSVPRQVPPPSDIRDKLDQIERLINEIRNALA